MSKSSYLSCDGVSLAQKMATAHGVSMADIRSPMRGSAITRIRHAIAWRLAKDTYLSLSEIGAIINRDHTSVMYSIWAENERTGENVRLMGTNPERRARNRINSLIYSELSREIA